MYGAAARKVHYIAHNQVNKPAYSEEWLSYGSTLLIRGCLPSRDYFPAGVFHGNNG